MNVRYRCILIFVVAGAVSAAARPAFAQRGPTAEIGTSLADLAVFMPPGGGDHQVLFGVPSGSPGIFTPSLYVSLFASRHIAIEPRIGLIVESSGGNTDHLLNAGADLAIFVDASRSSAYVFGGVGVIDTSGSNSNPKSVSGGVGYRIRTGGRLAFRLSGRFTHFTDNGGNALGFTFAIGGLLGGR